MISVIIPVLNEELNIESFLRDLNNKKGSFEVIVVDGGSEDNTFEIAKRYAKVFVDKKGRAIQMNRGADESNGDILLFLHADSYLPSDSFFLIEEALSDPNVIGGRFKIKIDNNRLIYRIISSGINIRDRISGGFAGDQGIFVRKNIFKKVGGYRNIPIMEDIDFSMRVKKEGKLVIITSPIITSARRWEKNGVIRTILNMWILRILFYMGVKPLDIKKFYKEVR